MTTRLLNAFLFYPMIRVYWFVFRPETFGVKCIIEHNGKMLMIRNTYGKRQWTFPGGGIEEGETPEDAAKREVREEVGIELAEVRSLGMFISSREHKKDNIYVYSGRVDSEYVRIQPSEILEAQWFTPDTMPKKSKNA